MQNMIITIYEGYDKRYILLGCKDERFQQRYGRNWKIDADETYVELARVASWVNNELGEECLFDID